MCDSQTTTVFKRSFSNFKDLFGIEPVAERRSARHAADARRILILRRERWPEQKVEITLTAS